MTEVDVKHWKHQKAALKVFWKRAGDLGLDEEEAHRALSVDGSWLPSLEDFQGTVAEAIAGLELYAAERSHASARSADDGGGAADVPEYEQQIGQSEPIRTPQAPAPDEVPIRLGDKMLGPQEPEVEPEPEPISEGALFEATSALPEMPAVAWCHFIDRNGFNWSFTIRAGLPEWLEMEALKSLRRQIEAFGKVARSLEWIPESGLYRSPSEAGTTSPPRLDPGAPPPPGMQAPSYGNGPQDAPQQQLKAGTAALKAIKVDADGRVEFHVDGYKYPFKDGRGPEVVLGLFNEAIVGSPNGWTEEHFKPGSKYEPLNEMVVDWEKPDRYYNVVRVRAG